MVLRLSEKTQNAILDRLTASFRTITIVVGPTGCGKSTLVPVAVQTALGGDGTILCTQPRRLAVVAVATRVAQMKQCRLGELVGYHVGQSNVTNSKETKIVFATAGILLEEILANGVKALERYECLLIDECHERSAESDLCLALLRMLMRSHPQAPIRIILMSATFDHQRYRSYFESVPGVDFVDVITLETAESFSSFYDRVQTFYLDDFVKMLPDPEAHQEFMTKMKRDPNIDLTVTSADRGKSLTAGLLRIIGSLASHLDDQEPKSAVFLIFAPTYRHLEQIYFHLVEEWIEHKADPTSLVLSVLHSSVDIEDCIRSMNQVETASSHQPRHILLASAIADSSITIPGVTCVIDTCRSLEVSWNDQYQKHVTIWSSRAICDQRRGRTGRTCPGRVFRCIPKGFYLSSLQEFETPQITLSECRDESMSLLSSASNEINKFQTILQQTLDPPPDHVVTQATKYLIDITACIKTPGQKSRILATEYGRLMSTMPLSIADARAVLTAAQYGHVHEMLLFKSIKTIRPAPIVSYFADDRKSANALMTFKPLVDSKDPIAATLAQMSAYIYWDIYWHRLRRRAAYMAYNDLTARSGFECSSTDDTEAMALTRVLKETCKRNRRDFGVWSWTQETEDLHTEWCRKHEINPTSVRAITESMDITKKILYLARFEPPWLRCCQAEPQWQRRSDWPLVGEDHVEEKDMLEWVYAEFRHQDPLRKKLESILVNPGAMARGPQGLPVVCVIPEEEACVHFLNGTCTYGEKCRNSHSVLAKRPVCKFFLAGSCSKGSSCVYAHGNSVQSKMTVKVKGKKQLIDPFRSFVPALSDMTLLEEQGPRAWFKEHGEGLLLFGESNFAFSLALASMGIKPALLTDFGDVDTSNLRFGKLDKSRMFGNIDATKIHTYDHLFQSTAAQHLTAFGWNFPYTGAEEDPDDHEDLILATMISMGLLAQKLGLESPQFGLSLQGDQFSRWSVQRIATQAGWHLISFCKFNHKDFGTYQPCRANGDPFPCEHGRFYVFQWTDAIA
jgi:HrpA-like RNA helicase